MNVSWLAVANENLASSPQTKKLIVAYHEAGHAIVMNALPEADPVHKVTIIPRGMAGGYTLALPEQDHNMLASKRKLITEMVGLLGGRGRRRDRLQRHHLRRLQRH